MLAHLNVEKDLRHGLFMMKYTVNHYKNFENVTAAFFISLILIICSISIELTIILVLTSMLSDIDIIAKYVSLIAITNVPKFYYSSLVDHKLVSIVEKQKSI